MTYPPNYDQKIMIPPKHAYGEPHKDRKAMQKLNDAYILLVKGNSDRVVKRMLNEALDLKSLDMDRRKAVDECVKAMDVNRESAKAKLKRILEGM